MKVTTLSELKKAVGNLVSNEEDTDFPAVITYNRGIELKTFKVTIEEFDDDFFIDSKGEKWVKVKEKD